MEFRGRLTAFSNKLEKSLHGFSIYSNSLSCIFKFCVLFYICLMFYNYLFFFLSGGRKEATKIREILSRSNLGGRFLNKSQTIFFPHQLFAFHLRLNYYM